MAIFKRILGDSFSMLPAALQHIHDERPQVTLRGRCDIARGKGAIVGLAAWLSSLPPAANNVDLLVTIARDSHGERWIRNFGGHEMRSRLWERNSLLAERLGLVTLLFALSELNGKIEWRVRGARCLGVPLPAAWFADACATEQVVNGRYTFDVRATLPIVGLLVHYRGWLAEHG